MAFKDVLLQLSGYPDPPSAAAIEQAVGFAEALGAHISALTFRIEIPSASNPLTNALLDVPGMVATERQKSATNAQKLISAFEATATRRGVPHQQIVESCTTSQLAAIVTEHARLHDLTIIPIGGQAVLQQYVAESVIFGSGRPTIVLPESPRVGRHPGRDRRAVLSVGRRVLSGSAPAASAGPYTDRRIALLTQHGKERVIGPVLEAALGCRVELVNGFDTDTLGSFTRDIPRAGTQIEAARKKVRIGMELSGLPLGLASEGSFGPDPMVGMFPWNVEFLVFIDNEAGLEIVGFAQGKANHAHLLTGEWAAAEAFARQVEFPAHHLVVRPEGENDPRIKKGIAAWAEFEAAFAWARAQSASGEVFLETDLRAHANPTRMENIRLAAEDLVKKLLSPCPACGAPGFWLVERVAGLLCADCGAPTRETRAEVHGCLKCAHRETRERSESRNADPGRCDYCNP